MLVATLWVDHGLAPSDILGEPAPMPVVRAVLHLLERKGRQAQAEREAAEAAEKVAQDRADFDRMHAALKAGGSL